MAAFSHRKTIIAGFPPFHKAEVQHALQQLGVSHAAYMVRGMATADIVDENLRRGLDPFRSIKADCLIQINSTTSREGRGFFPDLDPVLLKRLCERTGTRVVLITAPAETVYQAIVRHGGLAARLTELDIPGLPAGVGADQSDMLAWIDGYFSTVRAAFSDDPGFVEVDVSRPDANETFGAAFGGTLTPSFSAAVTDGATSIRFSDPVEVEREFSLHLRHAGPTKDFDGRVGIRTEYDLQHSPMWRSYLALNYASTTAAQMAGKAPSRIDLTADFPLDRALVDLFTHRVSGYGHALQINGEIVDRRYDFSPKGTVLAFGGGKESRLTYGLLKEIGVNDLAVVTTEDHPHTDIPELVKVKMFGTEQLEVRLLPGLMLRPAAWYYGGSLGENVRHTPWQYYYDYGSVQERKRLQAAFAHMGYEVDMRSPVSVLPSNICQRILCERYPEVAAHQWSMPFNSKNEKSLLVALLHLYHDLPAQHVVTADVLEEIVNRFGIEFMSGDFGANRVREPYRREAMALIHYLHRTRQFRFQLKFTPPDAWAASWVNHIHAYVDPDVPEEFMAIFREYASPREPAELDYCISV